MVGLAAVTWAIWLAHNRATFEKKMTKMPFEIVFSACSFLLYGAGLQHEGDAKVLRSGTEMIRSSTMNLMRLCAVSGNQLREHRLVLMRVFLELS